MSQNKSTRATPSKNVAILSAIVALGSLTACGPDLGCGSSDAKALLDRLARNSFKNPLTPDPIEAKRGIFTFNDIITVEKSKTRALCKATLHVKVTPGSDGVLTLWERDYRIEYIVEKTDDDRLYVTLKDF